MHAVWTRARSDLRRHMRSAIVLAVLIGLTSALALAAAEGAQRTDTAYARLRAAVNAPDEIIASGTGSVEALIPHVDFSQVALLPQVKGSPRWPIRRGRRRRWEGAFRRSQPGLERPGSTDDRGAIRHALEGPGGSPAGSDA